MAARIISGAEIAKQIREELKQEVERQKIQTGIVPGLVTILVGEDPASVSYVTGKQKTAKELGFYSIQDNQPADISEEALLILIGQYNNDPKIHGILVQLPLPRTIKETKILYAIDPKKDVDGCHPVSLGKLITGKADYLPCTPAGIQELLIRSGVKTKGAELVIVGRSNLVGKPLANIMLQKKEGANCTVTIVHTGTPQEKIIEHCRRADILVVAAGVAKYVKVDWIKEGAAVIDVGVTRIGMSESGKAILAGDVDFEKVKEKAGLITPVPGGVGPMTITMLMKNTVKAAKLAAGKQN
ncbi:MAG: tetrahydrofolate dehydrogenase/cyclohydrolase catalytic domain-containing protein [Thermodesulfobacteriota bacterium]